MNYKRINSTPWTAVDNAAQTPDRLISKIRWKICNYQKSIRLGKFTSLLIICLYSFKFITQIFLDNIFHVGCKFNKASLYIFAVSPYPPANKRFLIIRSMHETNETFPKTDWVDDFKMNLSGGHRSE